MAPTPPIIVKRAVLTGHPYRVHKKVVTMRYMFFNREDVLFYKPVQLVSKQGRRGWIKEALGTHGAPLIGVYSNVQGILKLILMARSINRIQWD